jgi:hypothetical protein
MFLKNHKALGWVRILLCSEAEFVLSVLAKKQRARESRVRDYIHVLNPNTLALASAVVGDNEGEAYDTQSSALSILKTTDIHGGANSREGKIGKGCS